MIGLVKRYLGVSRRKVREEEEEDKHHKAEKRRLRDSDKCSGGKLRD